MRRFKLVLEYDGTKFFGLQRQLGYKSVQQTIEEALFKVTQQKAILHAAGRTDAGVHAYGQVVHVDLNTTLEAFKLQQAINFYVREEGVVAIDCQEADETFHARFSARYRRYHYVILNRRTASPLFEGRVWHVVNPLDLSLMKEAAQHLLGHHDFTSFRSAHCQSTAPVRTLDRLDIHQENNFITLDVQAKSFLHNQVRITVGTLVEVGKKRFTPERVQEILHAKDRTKAGPTAPADGLYFHSVGY